MTRGTGVKYCNYVFFACESGGSNRKRNQKVQPDLRTFPQSGKEDHEKEERDGDYREKVGRTRLVLEVEHTHRNAKEIRQHGYKIMEDDGDDDK